MNNLQNDATIIFLKLSGPHSLLPSLNSLRRDEADHECICKGTTTMTSRNESMPMSGSIKEGQLGNVKAVEA